MNGLSRLLNVPAGESTAGASGHRNTWRIAYTIEPLREWIFRQHL
ncbi:hypothetical protein [Tatumella sp. JGM118]|nr:hypothetical protein [Tatumella sp. JGM118]